MSVMEPLVLPKKIALAVKRLHLLPQEMGLACLEEPDPEFAADFIEVFEQNAAELGEAILDRQAYDDLQVLICGNDSEEVCTGAIVLQLVRHFCFSYMWLLPLGTSVYFHPTGSPQLCLSIATSCPSGYLKLV